MEIKPFIKVVNTTSTSVAANSVIPLGNYVIGKWKNCILKSGNNILIRDNYVNNYKVTINITFSAPTAGVINVSLLQNQNVVTGGTLTETITTANTEFRTVTISTIVRTNGSCIDDVLSLITGSLGITMTNLDVDIVKI